MTDPNTDSKHRIVGNAMAPVDCQWYVVSGSSSSKSQSCKCLPNAGKSRAHPSAPAMTVRFERIILYTNNVGSILPMLPVVVRGRVSRSRVSDGTWEGACLELMQHKPWWLPSPLCTLWNLSAYLHVFTSYLQLQSV